MRGRISGVPHSSSSGAGEPPSRREMSFCHRIWQSNDGFFIYRPNSSVLGAGHSEKEEPTDQQRDQGTHKVLGREEGFLHGEGAAAISF